MMNGKFEDKLARLAFGDLSPDESARVEAQVLMDPAASQTLSEFRDIRDGLKKLGDVPEHQLSNERLRDAILTRGLRAEPDSTTRGVGLGAGWLWMPVAAVLFGFGLISITHRKSSGTPQVVMNPLAHASESVGFLLPRSVRTPTFVAMNDSTKVSGTSAVEQGVVHGTSRQHRTRKRARQDSKLMDTGSWSTVAFSKGAFAPGGTEFKPQLTGVLARNDPANGSESIPSAADPQNKPSILLVDANPDAATGVPTATEVGTANHVIVGD